MVQFLILSDSYSNHLSLALCYSHRWVHSLRIPTSLDISFLSSVLCFTVGGRASKDVQGVVFESFLLSLFVGVSFCYLCRRLQLCLEPHSSASQTGEMTMTKRLR